ncbi:hypothetical protein [Fulvivirga kasyanovii]
MSEQNDVIEFSKAIKELNDILKGKASGFSFDELYQLVPPDSFFLLL